MDDVGYKMLEGLVANLRQACQSSGLAAAEIAQILAIDVDELAVVVTGDIARAAMLDIWSVLPFLRRIDMPLVELLPTT
ncbi:hypothetical protein [Sphingomonas crocodyli]|uniref:Uncharacterized protein n=1 Tax=Sphingomonas crocodyli TaxID=1979270 RepID=A0A437LY42_9SPHN|nr:hypothetical protein [Sphingomonas crocodyli]RVT90325.1 hypothetical protein EOD43_18830 [Sphingomonas crocodyli]